ncbi:hypothetical protein CMI37_29630 [Candidatus Pacearchaeota archaeon]|nr:hypothetical protein [Candidatus Pacearchaeota archaeon]
MKYLSRMKIGVAILFGSLFTFGNLAIAQVDGSVWTAADGAAAFKIKYVGSGVGSNAITATTITLYDDAVATAYVMGDTSTNLASLLALLNTTTNVSGTRNFRTKLWAGLAADLPSNNLVAVSLVALTPNTWTDTAKWDTSAVKRYDVVTAELIGDNVTGGEKITSIYGDLTGTGDVTLNVYDNGSSVYQQTIVSPIYRAASDVTYLTNDVVNLENLQLGTGIRIKQGKVGFVRAARATTATTGGIGANVRH